MPTCPPYGSASGPSVPKPEQTLKTSRLLSSAILAGALIFAGVVVVVTRSAAASPAEPVTPILPIAAAGFSAALLVTSFLLRATFGEAALRTARERRGLDTDDPGVRALAFQTSTLVATAMNEGPALLACIGALITRDLVAFAPAFAVSLAGMLVHFPSAGRLDDFLHSTRDSAS